MDHLVVAELASQNAVTASNNAEKIVMVSMSVKLGYSAA